MNTTALGVASRRVGIGLIVVIVALVFTVGCAGQMKISTQPNIHWMFDTDGMMCVTPQDSALLFQYMRFLEERAKAVDRMLIF